MSRTYKDSPHERGRERRISVRAVRRDPPDLRKLTRALIQLAIDEAAAEAAAQSRDGESPENDKRRSGGDGENGEARR